MTKLFKRLILALPILLAATFLNAQPAAKDYRIVVSDSTDAVGCEAAQELSELLAAKCPTGHPGEQTIYIGAAGNPYKLKNTEYLINAKADRLLVTAGSPLVYHYAFQALADLINKKPDKKIPSKKLRKNVAKTMQKDGVVKRSNTTRIVFHNVYGYGEAGPKSVRAQMEASLYRGYDADVVCMQEMAQAMRDHLVPQMERNGYEEAVVQTIDNQANYTPVFYRKDKFDVEKSGWLRYDGPNDSNSKSVTWAKLRDKKSGKAFVVAATHFMWSSPRLKPGEANATRINNAKQITALLGNMVDKDTPVIFGGDLNTYNPSDPLQVIKEQGFTYAWEVAPVKDTLKSHHAYAHYNDNLKRYDKFEFPSTDYKTSLDYAFYKGPMTVKQYRVLHDNYALKVSDHCPIAVDFQQ